MVSRLSSRSPLVTLRAVSPLARLAGRDGVLSWPPRLVRLRGGRAPVWAGRCLSCGYPMSLCFPRVPWRCALCWVRHARRSRAKGRRFSRCRRWCPPAEDEGVGELQTQMPFVPNVPSRSDWLYFDKK